MKNLNSDENITTDILASALSATKTTFFKGSGTGYTGDIPAQSALNYGSFIVNVRNTYRYVIGINTEGKVFTNVYGGSAWYGWQELAFATSGVRTEVAQLSTSGTAVNYTASQTGYYTVIASTANTEGTCTAIIQDTSGNTLLRSTASLARWDNITCGLLPLKAGTTIKAVAIFPSGGGGSVMRIS